MSIRTTTPLTSVLLLALGLQSAMATETGKSLYEQRQGIYQGTSRGILLFGGNESKPAAAAKEVKDARTAAPGPGAAPSASPATAATPVTSSDRTAVFSTPSLNKLAPPSGIPLNAVRHQVGAERGVALPVAKTASDAKP